MNQNRIKILLVEDDPLDVRLVRKMLAEAQGRPFDVECVDRLAAALKSVAQDTVDLVLLDLFLPECKGIETLRRVLGVAPKVPVVVITNLDDEQSGVDAVRQGAQDYLVKGNVDSALMVRAIHYAIERKRTEDKLRESQEQLHRQEKLATLGLLAGGVAHELRNPLGAIKNTVYFLNMALEHPQTEVKESMEILNKEVVTCERIIGSLLQFARPRRPARRKVDLRAVLEEVLASPEMPGEIDVVNHLDRTLPAIFADREQLSIAFGNIALNAVQAMPDGGRLEVTSRCQNADRVCVSFSDTGSGLPRENVDTLFEPLFTTKAKGIGLGLAVARALVEAHGGTIEARGHETKGATFTVTLPVRETEAKEHGS